MGTGGTAGAAQAPAWTLKRVVTAGVIGNVLEWYDFAVYGFLARIIGDLFFPSADDRTSLLASFGTFAVGFLMRPVGAALFGHIGDRYGRARALLLSIALMAIPTFLMGLLPTYATIGLAAPVLLVFLRMLQGIAVGGEFTSSMVFLAEHAPPGRRGFFASFSMFGATAGTMLGSLVGGALRDSLTPEALLSWGWRAAFMSGIAVAVVGFVIRRNMLDTVGPSPEPAPLRRAFRDHRWQVLRICGLNVGTAVTYYSLFVYAATWIAENTPLRGSIASYITPASILTFLVVLPIAATVSDRIGRRRVLLTGMTACLLFAYPLVSLMHIGEALPTALGQMTFAALLACSMAPIPAAMCETFPHAVRVSAVSVGYGLAYAIFGGTALLVAGALNAQTGNDLAFVWYIIAATALSLVIALTVLGRHDQALP
jgi:MFS transporter, MHS family, proline/betaine transporter